MTHGLALWKQLEQWYLVTACVWEGEFSLRNIGYYKLSWFSCFTVRVVKSAQILPQFYLKLKLVFALRFPPTCALTCHVSGTKHTQKRWVSFFFIQCTLIVPFIMQAQPSEVVIHFFKLIKKKLSKESQLDQHTLQRNGKEVLLLSQSQWYAQTFYWIVSWVFAIASVSHVNKLLAWKGVHVFLPYLILWLNISVATWLNTSPCPATHISNVKQQLYHFAFKARK